MRYLFSALLLAGVVILGSGCATCCAPDDYTYSAYGGKWPRLDPVYGRVGSAFTPQVQVVEGSSPEVIEQGVIVDPQQPTVLER